MFGLLFMLVSLVGCLFAPLVRCIRRLDVRRVALPLFVPLILTLTVCAIADAGGGFFRGRNGPPPSSRNFDLHFGSPRNFNGVRGGVHVSFDRFGNRIVTDEVGRVFVNGRRVR